jgi:tetratricopeptide (TPR) repeat protein
MTVFHRPLLLAVAALCLGPAAQGAREQPGKREVIQQARRATALVVVPGVGSGTGFLVDRRDRLLVTCAHVTRAASDVKVFFPLERDGRLVAERKAYADQPGVRAVVVDVSPAQDLCLLQIDRLPEGVTAAPLAKAGAEPGDDVFTIGNPGSSGALWVYTSGSVRSVYKKKARLQTGQVIDARTIETQAPINRGDSGGPVFDSEGRVVGVNSYIDGKASLFSSCIDVTEVAGFLEQARRWLTAASAEEWRRRALHYHDRGLYARSVADLDRLVQARPDAPSYLLRARVLIQGAASFEVPARAYAFAVTDCVQALRLSPESPAAYALRGAAFRGMSALDQAVADYTEAIRLQPRNPDHHLQRGICHIGRRAFDAAARDLDEALRLDPNLLAARFQRARVLYETKEYPKALEAFSRALALAPDNANLYDWRGDCYSALGRHEEAIKDYTRAVELQPASPLFLAKRAAACNDARQYRAAAADCEKALALDRQFRRALFQRARAAEGEERHQVCVEDLDRVLALPVHTVDDRKIHHEALVLRGRVHLLGLKEYDNAIASLTRALETEPDQPEVLNLRGLAHGKKHDYARAIDDFSAALRKAPRSSVYLTNRGNALLQSGKVPEAIRDFTAAIALDPNDPQAYEGRAAAHEKAGQKEQSQADREQAARLSKDR